MAKLSKRQKAIHEQVDSSKAYAIKKHSIFSRHYHVLSL